jgi:multiple sugar transport system substrate-binding protein
MWGWNAGQIEQIFAEYLRQTGAQVTLNYSAVGQQETFQKLQTVVSAGLDLPDIVPAEIGQRGTMMSLNIWEDLSKAPYNFDMERTFEYFKPLCTNESGELVALPWDVSSAALAYKRDLAEKYLGTSDPAELQAMLPTWDAFVQTGRQLQADTGGKIFMFASLTNIYQIADGQNPYPIIWNNKLDMESSVRKTITKMVEFRNNKVVDNILETSPAYNASYADELHIFYPCASWSPDYQITPNDPNGIGRWGLMIPPEGCFSWGGSSFMVPRNAKHKKEGFDFVDWILSKEGVIFQHNELGFNIGNREAFQDPAIAKMTSKHFGDQNLGEILFVQAIPTITVRPVSLYDVAIQDTYNLVIESINSNASMDVNAAARLFETELRNKVPDLQ